MIEVLISGEQANDWYLQENMELEFECLAVRECWEMNRWFLALVKVMKMKERKLYNGPLI
jgi:hypothetical protein